ncbi:MULTISPECIES: hypothetical protein [unclassified Spirillospora]|uniref:hypothetical protein n=1 Tax=unclassified Spirillospora TaxID=2642701 RepID=UPI00371D396D
MPDVNLVGTSMTAIVRAIPEVEARTCRPVTVVGGLAVICRLGQAYRVTSDLDSVHLRSGDEKSQLEVLLESGAQSQAPAGVLIPTSAGEVRVDILEVAEHELDPLPADPNDRLHVMAHAWGAKSATSMRIQIVDVAGGTTSDAVQVRVALPGPLVAMKLQAVMNRPSIKEGTDLLDIVRLTLDSQAGPITRAQLGSTEPQIARDATLHAHRWFVEQKSETLRKIRAIPEGREIDNETVELVAELLLAELQRPD